MELSPGLYSSLVSTRLKSLLNQLDCTQEVSMLDKAEAPSFLSAKLEGLLKKAFEIVGENYGTEKQINLYNHIINEIQKLDPEFPDETIPDLEPKILDAILRTGETKKPECPSTSIVFSSLFTGSRGSPQLARELLMEMQSADKVDILVSFIKNSGYRTLLEGFNNLRDREIPVRIITTTYIGATDPECIEALSKFPNIKIKVSYDTKHTRLHAKAYCFYRNSGFSTAYVGSSNMSDPAMSAGLEWNIKVTNQDLPHIIKTFSAEFEGYWNSPFFIDYQQGIDKEKLTFALRNANSNSKAIIQNSLVDVSPYPFQMRILENLEAERENRGFFKNLVIAATGTGKTIITAIDYRNQVAKQKGIRPKMLFLAHRDEIVSQSLGTFRTVLKDNNFGYQMGGGRPDPSSYNHLFCTIQTFRERQFWQKIPKDFFHYIVIDEAHHASANSYQGVFELKPKILLGLTATPERMDGTNILEFFNNRVAAQLRLPEALEEKLLCPFQYYCVADSLDISDDKYWDQGKYNPTKLEKLYVDSNILSQRRVTAIFQALETYCIKNISNYKTIGFCVSIRHAEYMAKEFNLKGIKSVALTSNSNDEERKTSITSLKQGDISCVFTVDLFNEGVDIPEIDLVLFLRPTDSLTVYLQQLGRGLRHSKDSGKECLLVLDFVSQMHKRYRVDRKFSALLPNKRFNIQKEITEGFPHLPPGCVIQMERQAMEVILENIKSAYSSLSNYIPETIKAFFEETGLPLTFKNYINHYEISPAKVLEKKTWSEWKSLAGLLPEPNDPDLPWLKKSIANVCNRNSPTCLKRIKCCLDSKFKSFDDTNESNMLFSLLFARGTKGLEDKNQFKPDECAINNPTVMTDLNEIVEYCLDNTTAKVGYLYSGLPLELHACYGNDEIQAAFGRNTKTQNTQKGLGVLHFPAKKAYALLVTLKKSEKDFSESTRYKDYPINTTLFHWESQSKTRQIHNDAMNLIRHRERKYEIFLFVRVENKVDGLSVPYQFLGRVNQKEYYGERPITFVWELEHCMPAELLEIGQIGG
jgi:superfamily II DNA or RNA helicase/HKD family nuclease